MYWNILNYNIKIYIELICLKIKIYPVTLHHIIPCIQFHIFQFSYKIKVNVTVCAVQ